MKKFFKTLTLSFSVLLTLVWFIGGVTQEAQASPFEECRWKQVECENGEDIEVCLKYSGDGNTCTCGDETRDCDDNPVIQ